MDPELKCNRLTCRKALADKAVVTTCSHIFCVECANELFNASRLCPACETSLMEPDDVVVSSLHPSNDYKTSVLSGLTPSTVLEICGRAMQFWSYQNSQESVFQQAVLRNVTDKNAQLSKQLDNVVREANNEITLLNDKISQLERDLELDRRKMRDLQDAARDRDKEYQKLKAHYDKLKRKALLGGANEQEAAQAAMGTGAGMGRKVNGSLERQTLGDHVNRMHNAGLGGTGSVDVGALVGGMEATGIQRTPLVNRTTGMQHAAPAWQQQQPRLKPQRQPFAPEPSLWAPAYDESDSAGEVEHLLRSGSNRQPMRPNHASSRSTAPRVLAQPSSKRTSNGGFRPAGNLR